MQLSTKKFTIKIGIMFAYILKALIVPKTNHSNATKFKTTYLFMTWILLPPCTMGIPRQKLWQWVTQALCLHKHTFTHANNQPNYPNVGFLWILLIPFCSCCCSSTLRFSISKTSSMFPTYILHSCRFKFLVVSF